MTTEAITGGCQCGAVRYAVSGQLTHPHLCHCRMCQKAAGNYFMPLANVQKNEFEVTRGSIAWFASTDVARRGFCRECGTPLAYEANDAAHLNITLGSLDDAAAIEPVSQIGLEAKMPWFGRLDGLPGHATGKSPVADAETKAFLEKIRKSNRQHPDHDTEVWPPRQQN